MKEQLKISVRFFDDREIRAVWDDDCSKWWFSVLDIVGALNEEPDYTKVRNYWKYLKTKLKKENNQLVSVTNQLKLLAADGKSTASICWIVRILLKYPKVSPIIKNNPNHILTWVEPNENYPNYILKL